MQIKRVLLIDIQWRTLMFLLSVMLFCYNNNDDDNNKYKYKSTFFNRFIFCEGTMHVSLLKSKVWHV